MPAVPSRSGANHVHCQNGPCGARRRRSDRREPWQAESSLRSLPRKELIRVAALWFLPSPEDLRTMKPSDLVRPLKSLNLELAATTTWRRTEDIGGHDALHEVSRVTQDLVDWWPRSTWLTGRLTDTTEPNTGAGFAAIFRSPPNGTVSVTRSPVGGVVSHRVPGSFDTLSR